MFKTSSYRVMGSKACAFGIWLHLCYVDSGLGVWVGSGRWSRRIPVDRTIVHFYSMQLELSLYGYYIITVLVLLAVPILDLSSLQLCGTNNLT